MTITAAGAAFLPERLAKRARNPVLTLASDRAELTHFCCQHSRSNPLGWSSSSGRLKFEKTTQNNSG